MASWFESMFSGGAMQSMERALSTSSLRHRLILENIANADTPGYRRKDLDQGSFDDALRQATSEGSAPGGMLRHDGNNVDLETELAQLGQNGLFHNQMAGLLRKAFEQIRTAAAERPAAG
jgi:flagellar basal-body rod protein FlgB